MYLQDGWTALHSAVGNGQMDGVNILLHRSPDIITQTDNVSKHIIHIIMFWQVLNTGSKVKELRITQINHFRDVLSGKLKLPYRIIHIL